MAAELQTGAKSAPLGYQALSTAIVKSGSAPTLRPMARTSPTPTQSQALMCSGVMALSPVDGKFNGRMVAQGCWGTGPKKSGVFKKNLPKHISDKSKTFEAAEHPATQFRRYYERSDLPISVHHGTSPSIDWKVEPERLDYIYLLPIFFDGLVERVSPYSFLAYRGIQDRSPAAAASGESPRSKTEDADETKSVSSAIARAFAREKFQRPVAKRRRRKLRAPPPRPKSTRVMSFVAIVAYVMSGLTIVVVNKCVVRDSGLHAPALVSSMGALFTAMTTRFLVFIGKVEVREVDLTPLEFAIWRAFPVGVLAAGSLCFGNMSYIYLDAGFIQMLKAGTPALLLFVLSVCKIEKITPLSASLALTMVCGSALATLQQPNINTWGLIIQAASQACEVLQCTAVQNFLQKLGFNAFDAGYYLAPAVAMCCLLSSMAIEWPQIIRDQQVWLLCSQLPLLLASGSIGIARSLVAPRMK
eukprot:g32916.t1